MIYLQLCFTINSCRKSGLLLRRNLLVFKLGLLILRKKTIVSRVGFLILRLPKTSPFSAPLYTLCVLPSSIKQLLLTYSA